MNLILPDSILPWALKSFHCLSYPHYTSYLPISLGKSIVYTGFHTSCDFKHPLGVLGFTPADEGGTPVAAGNWSPVEGQQMEMGSQGSGGRSGPLSVWAPPCRGNPRVCKAP